MKKDLKSLKEKFGKFEIKKEEVKSVKGGICGWLIDGNGGYTYEPCERPQREEPL